MLPVPAISHHISLLSAPLVLFSVYQQTCQTEERPETVLIVFTVTVHPPGLAVLIQLLEINCYSAVSGRHHANHDSPPALIGLNRHHHLQLQLLLTREGGQPTVLS